MDDFERRPPAHDLSYLGDLDRGLDLDPKITGDRPPDPVPVRPASRSVNEVQADPEQPTGPDRPLLNLFPMRPGDDPLRSPLEADEEPLAELLDIGDKPHRASRLRYVEEGNAHTSHGGGAPPYGIFYALWEHPFAPAPDPRFLYHSTAYDRAEHQLIAAIDRRDGLMLLTGDAGIGKTMLCRAALARIDRRTFTAYVDNAFHSIETLLKTLLLDFGVISSVDLSGGRLAQATSADLTLALREFLRSLAPLKARAVVLIDDAHRLSPEMLTEVRALAGLDGEDRLMQVVLVGQPELAAALGRREADQGPARVSARVPIDRLEREEIGAYLSHRLNVASDGQSRVEFDDEALSLIYELSNALPSEVNQVADSALARGFDLSSSLIDRGMVESAGRDLGKLATPTPTVRIFRHVAIAMILLALVLVGAAAGLFVFRQQVHRAIVGWQAVPTPPADPVLPSVTPFEPTSPDAPQER